MYVFRTITINFNLPLSLVYPINPITSNNNNNNNTDDGDDNDNDDDGGGGGGMMPSANFCKEPFAELVCSPRYAEKVCELLVGSARAAARQHERYDSHNSATGGGAQPATVMDIPIGFGLPWSEGSS